MAIYQPYFYIIQDKRTGIYYAGAKWAKDANPSTFMIEDGYQTSSETIRALIRKHGIDNFTVRKLRVFDTALQAQQYETNFLRRVNAKHNPKFYNAHNNDKTALFGTDKFEILMNAKYGVKSFTQTEAFKEKARKTKQERYGNENYNNQEKGFLTKLARYGDRNYNNRESAVFTNTEKFGHAVPTKNREVMNKIYETNLARHGVKLPLQSAEIMERVKNTNNSKYGSDFYVQTDEFKERRKETYEKLSSRPIVSLIKEITTRNGITLFQGWYQKSDDFLDSMLESLTVIENMIVSGENNEKIYSVNFCFKFRIRQRQSSSGSTKFGHDPSTGNILF